MLGCAWTVYSNIFAASVYPSINTASFDAPVVRRPVAVAARPAAPSFNDVFASLPSPVLSKPETVSPSIMFNERFAAAAPQSQLSKVADTSALAEAPRLADASKPVDAPKLAEVLKKVEAPKLAQAPKPKEAAQSSTQVALNVPAPAPLATEAKPADAKSAEAKSSEAKPAAKGSIRDMAQRAKTAVMSIASSERQSMVEKLWGKRESGASLLSYASADASVTGSLAAALSQNPMLGGSPPYDRQTAVYDISARMVYLPDGTKLEAHSGLGSRLDDPRSSHLRMVGVTPPHIYELKPREALFHGVPALRLNPIGGEDKIFGRSGLLAHTFMLGPNGDSNGCVSFKDYDAFLNAYRNQGIRRLAVLAKVE